MYSVLGSVDIHFLDFGNKFLFIPLAISGSISVIAFSCALNSCKSIIIRKVSLFLSWFGCNSLFIMATHEYLGLKKLIRFVTSWIGLECNHYYVVFEVIILILIEVVLCLLIAPLIDKLINYIGKRIKCR